VVERHQVVAHVIRPRGMVVLQRGAGDVLAGDGVYSGSWDQDGVHLIWTVTPSRSGSLAASGQVILEARAVYTAGEGPREVRVGTLRANPVFVGSE